MGLLTFALLDRSTVDRNTRDSMLAGHGRSDEGGKEASLIGETDFVENLYAIISHQAKARKQDKNAQSLRNAVYAIASF
jgi:hypothetical protein